MYHIDIMTLFPDTVGDVLSESILGRAQERDLLRINTHQIRDYTLNKQTRCTSAGPTSAVNMKSALTPSAYPPAAKPLLKPMPNGWPGSTTI